MREHLGGLRLGKTFIHGRVEMKGDLGALPGGDQCAQRDEAPIAGRRQSAAIRAPEPTLWPPAPVTPLNVTGLLRSPWNVGRILLVGDRLQPIDILPVDRLLNGHLGDGAARRGAMPMFETRRNPHDVSGIHDANRAAPLLHKTTASRNDEDLAQGMRVPCRPSTGLKEDIPARQAARAASWEQLLDLRVTGEVRGGPRIEGSGLGR